MQTLSVDTVDACQALLDAAGPRLRSTPLTWFALSAAAHARVHTALGNGVLHPFMSHASFVLAGGAVEGLMCDVLGFAPWAVTPKTDIDVFVLNLDGFFFLRRWLWTTAEEAWTHCTARGAIFNVTLVQAHIPPVQFVLRFGLNVVAAAKLRDPLQSNEAAVGAPAVAADVLYTDSTSLVSTFDLTHSMAALRWCAATQQYQVGLYGSTLTAWRSRISAPVHPLLLPTYARCLKAAAKGFGLAHTHDYDDLTPAAAAVELGKLQGYQRESVFPAHARVFWAHRLLERVRFGIQIITNRTPLAVAAEYDQSCWQGSALSIDEVEDTHDWWGAEGHENVDAMALFGQGLRALVDPHTEFAFALDTLAYPCAHHKKWRVSESWKCTSYAERARRIDSLRAVQCEPHMWQFILEVLEARDRAVLCAAVGNPGAVPAADVDLVCAALLCPMEPRPDIGALGTVPAFRAAVELEAASRRHSGSLREAAGKMFLALGLGIGTALFVAQRQRAVVNGSQLLRALVHDPLCTQCAPSGIVESEVANKVLGFL